MTVFIKNSTFCKSSHNLIYVKIYISQIAPILPAAIDYTSIIEMKVVEKTRPERIVPQIL